jgi:uncharacterized protein
MGLAGGPHCVAMCGAACAALGRARAPQPQSSQTLVKVRTHNPIQHLKQTEQTELAVTNTRAMWLFQAGRLLGYSCLGGLAAASMQGLGWLSVQSAALRPVWTLFHVAAALLGAMLLWQARQPVWLEAGARKVWRGVQAATGQSGSAAPLLMGTLWALLPCGLLYSALLVAAMTSSAAEGAAVMALFALGSSVSLMAGPWLWLRLRGQGSGQWAIRLAGLALLASSVWALWMGLVHNTAPWCLST